MLQYIRDANAALQINPDSVKGYEVRGMARASLGQWEGAASDLHVASKLDYDEEIGVFLKKHCKKYERLRKEKVLKKVERERKRQAEAQVILLNDHLQTQTIK